VVLQCSEKEEYVRTAGVVEANKAQCTLLVDSIYERSLKAHHLRHFRSFLTPSQGVIMMIMMLREAPKKIEGY